MSDSFALFDTALGRGGIAWRPSGAVAVAFPDTDEARTRARLERRAPGAVEGAPSSEIAALIADIIALFAGEKRGLSHARLDMSAIGVFERRVYKAALAIPPGETRTYGDIARALGDVALSQRVGQALARNPFPVIVPCHRVVGADGRMTGFSAPGGTAAKEKLLKIEGALAKDLFDAASPPFLPPPLAKGG